MCIVNFNIFLQGSDVRCEVGFMEISDIRHDGNVWEYFFIKI